MNDERHETDVARAVRRQLVDLVARHGPGILDDTRRVRAMLADAVRGATAETNLIGLALSSGVPARLREAGQDPARVREAVAATARDLEQTSSVQGPDARWAVSTVAEAMGLHAAATLRPVPAAAGPSSAPPGAGSEDLVVSVGDREHVASAASVVTVGRDPGSTIMLDSPAVSRRHARLQRGASGWEYHDVGSTQGSFVNGVAVTRLTVTEDTEVTLGQGPDSLRMRLVPFGVAATHTPNAGQRPAVAPSPVTEIPRRPPRPGGALAGGTAARTELGGSGAQELTVSLGGITRTVTPGRSLTVGREDDNDLIATTSTASRHHLRVEHRDGAWQLHDLGSTSGTWLDGRRVSDVTLQGHQEIVVGDLERGDRLVTRTAGTPGRVPRPVRPASAGGRRKGALVAATVAGATALTLGLGFVVWRVVSGEDAAPASASADTALTRDDLARGTVLLEADSGSGSGVIVDREQGLILTNAHVAAPSAVGLGIASLTFADEQDPNPSRVLVHVSGGLDESAEPRFYAEVVAVDGYLDVAVLRIDRKVSGAPVDDEDLADLVEVPLGDSDDLRTSDEISLIGYPEAAQSAAPTFTTGVVSGPVQDDRLDDFRAVISTTATSSFGNSGGLAFDDSGAMVGVPTWGLPDRNGQVVLSGIRPINLAKPVIEAARAGKKYTSPWVVAGPARAKVSDGLNYAEPGAAGGVTQGCENGPVDLSPLAIGIDYSSFPGGPHTDVVGVLYGGSGEPFALAMTEFQTRLPKKGCMTLTFGRDVPPGQYDLKIGVGGDLKVLYDGGVTLP